MRFLAVIGGVVFALLGAIMVVAMIDIAGTTPCEDVVAGECFDGSASKRTVVVALGLAGGIAGIATLGLAIYYAARDRHGGLAAWAAACAVVLTAIALLI